MKSIKEIEQIIDIYRRGGMVIIVDDEDRENEGDLAYAGQFSTAEKVNFMAKYGRGLICTTLESARLDEIGIPPMVTDNTSYLETAFAVSVEAKVGTTTGISAGDRNETILRLADPTSTFDDFVMPGHMFPLRAKKGGVLKRVGQTEASVDLAKLGGLEPVGVICEIMSEDGTMSRMPELEVFAKEHAMPIISVADIVRYRRERESLVERIADANLPTRSGDFQVVSYVDTIEGKEHLALVKGDITGEEPVLVRVHSECLTGDVLGSRRCDCGNQLHLAMSEVEKLGRGVILYLRQEGRGIGLSNKIKAYKLQDQGRDTVEANRELGFDEDLRDYGIGAQMLQELGVKKIQLMTNNPRKIIGLEGYGIEIVERVPHVAGVCDDNRYYLQTKKNKLGHLLEEGTL